MTRPFSTGPLTLKRKSRWFGEMLRSGLSRNRRLVCGSVVRSSATSVRCSRKPMDARHVDPPLMIENHENPSARAWAEFAVRMFAPFLPGRMSPRGQFRPDVLRPTTDHRRSRPSISRMSLGRDRRRRGRRCHRLGAGPPGLRDGVEPRPSPRKPVVRSAEDSRPAAAESRLPRPRARARIAFSDLVEKESSPEPRIPG